MPTTSVYGTDSLLAGADSLAYADTGSPVTGADTFTSFESEFLLTDADSMACDSCAAAWTQKLFGSIAGYFANLDILNILKMVGLSLLVLVVLFALYKLTSHVFRRIIDRRIIKNRAKWFRSVRFRNIEVVSSNQLVKATLFMSRVTRYAIYALLLYIALPLIFAIFPATRSLAGVLFSWVVTPVISIFRSIVAYLPKLLRIAVIIVIMRYFLKFLKYIAQEIEAKRLTIPGFYPDWAHATLNLFKVFIYAFTIVLIFPLLPESESGVFKGVSVFIGILFSIGSSSVISNMMAGMVITYMRSFKVGDRIKVGDVYGDVVEKTLFVVRIETVKREIVTVPNSTMLSSNITNYSIEAHEKGVILYMDIRVGYDVAWQKAHELLINAAMNTEHVLHNPKPFVLTRALEDSATVFQINAYTKKPELQARICSELNGRILDAFQSEGIEMVTPIYEAIRKGDASTIPPVYHS